MSEAMFTPGPWEFANAGVGKSGKFVITEYFVRRPGDDVAIAADVVDPASGAPSEANACLIAAAPELLEALRDMLAGWIYIRQSHGDLYGVGWDRAQGKAESAMKKALGRI